ncbi:unnamed protein product [Durusdinium trenchii]|uniref:Uncharacterized protein n=1 Tax=Durusdinium trenchii TaxID=1381693 RepID=A0ABP0HIZ4_9DINO
MPDVSKKKEHTVHADGQYEVLLPVSLPDEGGFDWLDQLLGATGEGLGVKDFT